MPTMPTICVWRPSALTWGERYGTTRHASEESGTPPGAGAAQHGSGCGNGSTHVRMRLAQVARLNERQPRYTCSVGEHVRNVRKVKALSQRVSPKVALVDRLLLYSVNHEVAQASRGPSSFVPRCATP
eukprot:scaffold60554_cov72-Phaeocystis_antarctica.AAC.3